MRKYELSIRDERNRGQLVGRVSGVVCITKFARVLTIVGAVLIVAVPVARADVQTSGNVLILDNTSPTPHGDSPFTPGFNEGIPRLGNSIDPFEGPATVNPNPPALFTNPTQTNFEGRPNDTATANINFDIYVGLTSTGQMQISTLTELRDMNLIIGDSGEVNGQQRRGTGTVRIEGFGAVFNNDPNVMPFGFDPAVPLSANPRLTEAGHTKGFDVYVGRNGTGTLQFALGGRAEIEDAFLIGDQSGSVGSVVIDGIDSSVQSGGFLTQRSTGANFEPHEAYVGRIGSGSLAIRNGGQMTSFGPDISQPTEQVVAAVIGSNRFADNDNVPENGGVGVATVDGTSSKWTIGGTFQIGGFHNSEDPNAVSLNNEDISGVFANYAPGVGHGTLNVSNGGLVSVVAPPLQNVTQAPNPLDIWVGRFGKIQLATGGRIELNGVLDNTSGGNPITQVKRGRLINDGVVGGSGTISVLQFRNRVLGEVRVAAGEKLYVAATGQFDPVTSPPDELPFSNYGLIEALGNSQQRAEIEFDRGPFQPGPPPVLTQPFFNLQAGPTAQNGRTKGEIFGQDATFRFRSGLDNRGILKFTGGTNIVSGDVLNNTTGLTLITGNSTTVTFEDDFTNNGLFQIEGTNSPVTIDGDLILGANSVINYTFGSHIAVAGDLILTGSAFYTANLLNLNNLAIGDRFSIITYAGSLIGSTNFTGQQDLGNGFVVLPVAPSSTPGAIQIRICSDMGICTAGGMLPGVNNADLDGNGIVDADDLAIWAARFGLSGLGDVNGNGIVDAADYSIIRDHFGHPSGAGSGSGLSGAVPEPSSIALLASVAGLMVARRRRSPPKI